MCSLSMEKLYKSFDNLLVFKKLSWAKTHSQ